MIKIKTLLKTASAVAILAGSLISVNALAYTYGTCTVQDANGRTFTQVGNYPCNLALNACVGFHNTYRGTSGATCHIVSGPTPVPPPGVPVPPPVPPVAPPPAVPPIAPPPAATCYAHDNAGRQWHWTGGSNPCASAIAACQQWHQARGYSAYSGGPGYNCYIGP